MTRKSQKQNEMKAAKFFLERLNLKYNLDFYPKSNDDENGKESHVDVYGVSEKKKSSIIKLQLTIYDGRMHKLFADMNIEKKKTGKSTPRSFGGYLVTPIEMAIQKKEKKAIGDEILILYNDFDSRIWNKNGAKKMLCPLGKETKYLGIFVLSFPSPMPGIISTDSHNGQIVAIKNPYGLEGDCF